MEQYLLKSFDLQERGMDLWECVSGEPYAFFLDSSQYDPSRGRYSLIGFDPFDTFTHKGKDTLALLKKKFSPFVDKKKKERASPGVPLSSGIVGYLSYDYGLYHEKICLQAQDDLRLPDAFFGFYDCLLTIDHFTQKVFVTSSGLPERNPRLRAKRARERLGQIVAKISPGLNGTMAFSKRKSNGPLKETRILRSNFTKEQYKRAIKKALSYIGLGDIYQVNLSQRFEMDCAKNVLDSRAVYRALREISPAPFGGYIDCGNFTIISNSPERFLRLENGIVETRPMKGTRPRGEDPARDQALRSELVKSAKEKAELLMITDLLRNDLGKVCDYGSVKVREMRAIEEYGYVFQATSTVEGVLKGDKDCFDLLSACFPGGSVTGCPKIRAMEIIEELEPTRRGIYTGAMGYISFDGDMDFNILIRTLLAHQGKLYFQVGGGIVSDSTPEKEYEETLVKARAIQEALGIGANVSISKETVFESRVFLDGKIVKADRALLDALTPGILKGKGVFETMRVSDEKVGDLERHLDRLFKGLRFLKMRASYTRGSLTRHLKTILRRNSLRQARVRLAVWRENGKKHTAIVCQPWEGYSGKKYETGFHVIVSGIRRKKTRDAHIKSLNYGVFRQAFLDAQAKGYDEAVLLNNRKEVVEGTRTNIFFVKKGVLLTPAIKGGCLNGITRRQVIQCARELGIPFKTVQAPVRELLKADEAFCTNSLLGVMPLTSVSGVSIGSGRPGLVTKKLSEAYNTISHSSCPS